MNNRLQYEKSPYLLQHKDNPVDWYPWGKDAFAKAKAEDKPVFLSIGYSTCHWCHVMAHESFEDPQVAALLNESFVCVKVDREERPDIDAVYMAVCQALTGAGGWPLTILMTAEQQPFFAGTYFPKRRRLVQPGLMELLTEVVRLWQSDRERLLSSCAQIAEAIRRDDAQTTAAPDKGLHKNAYVMLRRSFDPVYGGFGGAPKFPTPHQLLFLMRYAAWENAPDALHMATQTLDAMARGGIHDQIGGGFCRYSTDDRWLVPHFEKMLYDNALLLTAYLEAYQRTKEEPYADVARRTADYILRELTDPSGGFYCGQDADSDGVEGKYYVFTPQEIQEVLGEEDGAAFCRLYDIKAGGHFAGCSIPNRIGQREKPWQADDARLQKLYEYRLSRVKLHKDDKILLSWNAWTIIALAKAGRVLDARYGAAAIRAQRFLEENMKDPHGRLLHRFRDGEAAHAAQLEDYAAYILALIALYQLTFEPDYLRGAVRYAEQMTEHFEDREKGGFYLYADDAPKLILRPKESYDGAIPSGNSAAAMALANLKRLTGEISWHDAADRQLGFLTGQAKDYPPGHCFGLLALAETLYPQRELICACRQEPPELTAYLRRAPSDALCVLLKTPRTADALAALAPFTKPYPIPDEGAVYYLCENKSCRQPVTDFFKLPLEGGAVDG